MLFKTTNLRLMLRRSGTTECGAPQWHQSEEVIFLTFDAACSVAGFIAVNKAGRHDSVNLLKPIMMDADLAVAITLPQWG